VHESSLFLGRPFAANRLQYIGLSTEKKAMETAITNKPNNTQTKRPSSVTYTLLLGDYLALWDHEAEKRASGCLIAVVELVSIVAVIAIWVRLFGAEGQIADLGTAGLIILVVAVMSYKTVWRGLRNWLWAKSGGIHAGRCITISLSTEDIVQKTDSPEKIQPHESGGTLERRISWGAVNSIEYEDRAFGRGEHAFITMNGSDQHIVLPKRAFATEKDFQEFVEEARHLWEVFLAIGPTPTTPFAEDSSEFPETRIKGPQDLSSAEFTSHPPPG
jgi:hypothetical protein